MHDLHAINMDPLFFDPGKGVDGINSVDGYIVLPDSPVTGAGFIIPNHGGLDFWGNPLPDSTLPDIGAFQTSGSNAIHEKIPEPQVIDMSFFPNPFSRDITIRYTIQKSAKVSIRIYNTLGEHIRTLYERNASPGSFSIMWNGEDNTGNRVAPGTFFLYLGMDNSFRMAKIICI